MKVGVHQRRTPTVAGEACPASIKAPALISRASELLTSCRNFTCRKNRSAGLRGRGRHPNSPVTDSPKAPAATNITNFGPYMPRLRCANAPTTATLFIQLSMRRQAVSCGLPILDVLLPVSSRAARAPFIRAHHAASTGTIADTHHHAPSPTALSYKPGRGGTPRSALPKARATPLCPPSRPFSTSSSWRATHAIFNPQVDDDGKDMVLEITQRAAKVLHAHTSTPSLFPSE